MKQYGKVYITPNDKFVKIVPDVKGWKTYPSYTINQVHTLEQATFVGVDLNRPLMDINSKRSWDICLKRLQYLDVEVNRKVEIVNKERL